MDIISTFNLFRLKSKNYKYFADNIFLPHSNRTLKCYQEPLECKQGEPYARFDFITNPSIHTRNTLTQASKNGRKLYSFPQKKFVIVFYAINIFNTIYYFKPTNINCA